MNTSIFLFLTVNSILYLISAQEDETTDPILRFNSHLEEDDTEEYKNIIKGLRTTSKLRLAITSKNTYPPIDLCVLGDEPKGDVLLQANIVYHELNTNDIMIRIDALDIRTRKVIESYEVENSNLSPTKETYKEEIIKMKICDSFDIDKFKINNKLYFFIKFMNNGEEWCDVYLGYSFKNLDMDKCSVIIDEYMALGDPIYNSVDIPSNADFRDEWTACPGMSPVEICTKEEQFQIKASPYCYNGLTKYLLTTTYNGLALGTYKITNLPTDKNFIIEPERACRLIKFQKTDKKKQSVYVQYFNNGHWHCQQFARKNDSKFKLPSLRKGIQYNPQLYWGWCHRFRNYKRPIQNAFGKGD